MWAEQVDDRNIEPQVWPRTAAAAERLWASDKQLDDASFADVQRRLSLFSCLLAQRGISSSPIEPGYCMMPPSLSASVLADDRSPELCVSHSLDECTSNHSDSSMTVVVSTFGFGILTGMALSFVYACMGRHSRTARGLAHSS